MASISSEAILRRMVLISFAPNDEPWRQRVRTHLALLKHLLWDRTDIRPGLVHVSERKRMLEQTAIAIVIVSSDYIDNDDIVRNELNYLLSTPEITVLPLIVRSCHLPDDLAALEPTYRGPSLASRSESEQDDILARIAQHVKLLSIAERQHYNNVVRPAAEVMQNLDNLVSVFQIRAKRLIRDAEGDSNFCLKFNELHLEHIDLLKNGKLIEAHEVLTAIYAFFRKVSISGSNYGAIRYGRDSKPSIMRAGFIYDAMNMISSGLSHLQEPSRNIRSYCASESSDMELGSLSTSTSCLGIILLYAKILSNSPAGRKLAHRDGAIPSYSKDVAVQPDESFILYSRSAKYVIGTLLLHTKFGKGIVVDVGEASVEVLFEGGAKRLVHKGGNR